MEAILPRYAYTTRTRGLEDIFDTFFGEPRARNHATPPANILRDEDGGFTVEIITPGYSRDDFQISAEDGKLEVRVEAAERDYTGKMVSQEHIHGSWLRSWSLPRSANAEAISARYEAGILYIDVPTKEEKSTRTLIRVE